VAVGLAPYAVWAVLLVVFVVGYLAALGRFLCAGAGGEDALERLVVVSVNAVVSILTLTPTVVSPKPGAGCRCIGSSDSAPLSVVPGAGAADGPVVPVLRTGRGE
jgi:hypothetical protein